MRRIAVLISGRGSNLQAIIDACESGELPAHVAVVVSNRRDAAGLARAQAAGIETVCLDARELPGRQAYDRTLARLLCDRSIDLVCLAGFMRVVGPEFLNAFPNRILNIHPSLLPAFPGLNAQQQALDHGVRITGATVHIVTSTLDNGPIVVQAAVPILDDDTVETLSARILDQEHRVYPQAIRLILQGRWHLSGRRFITE
jgi:phosphoribosylglycinamide formyltransferase 1